MKIKIDDNNIITSYALLGNLNNGISISQKDLPENFEQDFIKGYFIYDYSSESVIINESYEPDLPTPETPNDIPRFDVSDMDISQIKKMVSTLQKQGVKNNLIISNLLKENEGLKNKITNLESNLGGDEDGTK